MLFSNRAEAGEKLAAKLSDYKGKNVVVFALPRGGVITGLQVAKKLNAPLDLIVARKIGHPMQPEYALAAISENGQVVGNKKEIASVDQDWFKKEKEKELKEAKRRRSLYLAGKSSISAKNKIVIVVDDGIATGLTIKAAIKELKLTNPSKIVVATPVVPKDAALDLKKKIDQLVTLEIPSEFYAISNYYEEFPQVTDEEVVKLMKASKR